MLLQVQVKTALISFKAVQYFHRLKVPLEKERKQIFTISQTVARPSASDPHTTCLFISCFTRSVTEIKIQP